MIKTSSLRMPKTAPTYRGDLFSLKDRRQSATGRAELQVLCVFVWVKGGHTPTDWALTWAEMSRT